jgi:flagellar motor protein MotB
VAKGGGAWKVAYADFVTAMMAFFLVMWICGQDQSIKRAVSYYFTDPFGDSKVSDSKKPSRTGAVSEYLNTGSVPHSESVAMGRGRKTYSAEGPDSPATKAVSDWLFTDKKARDYWHDQAQKRRDLAKYAKDMNDTNRSPEEVATLALARQLREEMLQGVPADADGVYRDLLYQALGGVNWAQLAEDLLSN